MDINYYLNIFSSKKELKATNLERISYAINKINYVKTAYIIHVAGTNGKGSTVSFLKSILLEENYSVTTFISPFVTEFNERITLNKQNIKDEEFIEISKYILEIVDINLSYFEYLFIVYLEFSKRNKVDFMIVEVGIGGKYDCTNVIETDLQLLTNASLDHTDILGKTKEEILEQKLGIFKKYLITTDTNINYIKNYFKDNTNYEIISDIKKITEKHFKLENKEYIISLKGDYQFKNAALAIKSSEYISNKSTYKISETSIKKAVSATYWPGRFEEIGNFTIDGAHNIDGIEEILKNYKKRENLVICQMKDKLSTEINSLIKNAGFKKIYVYILDYERAITKEDAINFYDFNFEIINDLSSLDENELYLCIGSLYFVSELKKILSKN